MINFTDTLLILASYLLGSIPSAFIVGHWIKGRDLRQYGSGTVSGSMVYEHIARWAVVPVGLFDVAKAALPAWLALQLGGGLGMAVTCGLAAAIGHNWPIYLNFTGGRGLSTFIGLLLIIFPLGIPWLGVFLLVGYLLKDSPPYAIFSLTTMPALAAWLDGRPVVIWATIFMLIITVVKRLEANRRPLPGDARECRVVLLRRLILDRDITSHRDWIDRVPEENQVHEKQ